ncbi:MAG: bifunctional phosphopantothenoylcysteine decarboxylase/phosphopantothenate--cysteine ligase CoaBC [Clostridia bacterium]|nr:bifunctional phosphopantothenoylcysteine decarboxylase/phosphopantothenate--cysteine ligase CoaBC [Clostridia bacterium]
MLKDRHIVLGVSGGIAAYKACELTSRLVKRGASVRVILTESASTFVPPLTFQTLTGEKVFVGRFAPEDGIAHISLAQWADAFLIAPATANCLAKLTAGIADDILTSTALAMTAPTVVAPAMNGNMWRSAATRENVERLSMRGVRFIGPASGHLACGDEDVGRMSEPDEIVSEMERLFSRKSDLLGRRVLVTAGPTVEKIDPVRYITNRSSGKMGFAIAEAAADRGASVTLISGPVHLPVPNNVEYIGIGSSAELCEAVLEKAETADAVIQAAAPADYTPSDPAKQKIKKESDDLTLHLVKTRDIAAALGRKKRAGQVLVAFAAETENLLENARGKLERKNADLIVANDVTQPGAGFGTETNIIALITRTDVAQLPLMSKREAAEAILDRVVCLLGKG